MTAILAAEDKLWSCSECREAGLDKSRFCEEDSPSPLSLKIDGEEYYRCPVQFVTDESVEALSAYQFYKAGFLPGPGGFMDQETRFIEQMQTIEAVVSQALEEKRRRIRKGYR